MNDRPGRLHLADVLDARILDLANALKPAQQSMHESWRRSGLYYERIDDLRAACGNQATPFIIAAKLAGLQIHLGRAADAVRSSQHTDNANEEVAHNLVDLLLGILDLAELIDVDLGDQMTRQLAAAMQGFSSGARQPKVF